jgi:hypothetical protein
MSKSTADDLDAVRSVVIALEGFEANDQERILRWAREKLGLSTSIGAQSPSTFVKTAQDEPAPPLPATSGTSAPSTDIKTFIESRKPSSDNQFAATVAYYYQFEAPAAERKEAITADDLQQACRKAGRERLRKPAQTLINTHNQGYLDKAAGRGAYLLNSVGENLVAMALPDKHAQNRSPPAARPMRKISRASNVRKTRGRGRAQKTRR